MDVIMYADDQVFQITMVKLFKRKILSLHAITQL